MVELSPAHLAEPGLLTWCLKPLGFVRIFTQPYWAAFSLHTIPVSSPFLSSLKAIWR